MNTTIDDEKKTIPKAPPKRSVIAALEAEEGIPVRQLHFQRPSGIEVPGRNGATLLRAVAPELCVNLDRYEITLLPRLRAFRCVYVPANKEKPRVTFFVHETWATWEPAEQ